MVNKNKYRKPNLKINKVYTRKGDNGETRLVTGEIVLKNNPRVEAYGDIDELNNFRVNQWV